MTKDLRICHSSNGATNLKRETLSSALMIAAKFDCKGLDFQHQLSIAMNVMNWCLSASMFPWIAILILYAKFVRDYRTSFFLSSLPNYPTEFRPNFVQRTENYFEKDGRLRNWHVAINNLVRVPQSALWPNNLYPTRSTLFTTDSTWANCFIPQIQEWIKLWMNWKSGPNSNFQN